MWMRTAIIGSLFFFLISAQEAFGQKSRLAYQYFQNGEFEKAAQLYLDVYKESYNVSYFKSYVRSLDRAGLEERAIAELQNEIQNVPHEVSLYVTLGSLLEGSGKLQAAEEVYLQAIDQLKPVLRDVIDIGNEFVRSRKYDLAIKTYEKGRKMIKDKGQLAYYLGDVYRRKSDHINMIHYFLISLEEQPYRVRSIENRLQQELEDDQFEDLQAALFDRIQKKPMDEYYELLIWSFIYTKKYNAAMRQSIALDRRKGEAGKRVMSTADIASAEGAYDTAIRGYEYVISQGGNMNPYYFDATEGILNAKRDRILSGDYSEEDLLSLKKEYKNALKVYGQNKYSAGIQQNLARLEAYYLGNIDSAIFILDKAVKIPDLDNKTRASLKLDLGDYYVMEGERWEATLLYSQVDKDFEEDPLGHEARYRNAKLAYYMGDFEWAQVQFDVLKSSTSKLISNDAIDMSVFIMDNLGLDTNEVALTRFARSDLFRLQRQYDSSLVLLRQIKLDFPDHELLDDVIYREATIYRSLNALDKAVERYEYLIKNYPEAIKTDNALFELAELYDKKLMDPEKAKELYEKLFIDYDSSTFATEARKRYRRLRGDEV